MRRKVKTMARTCEVCGKEFMVNNYTRKMCSRECRNIHFNIVMEERRKEQKLLEKKEEKEKKEKKKEMKGELARINKEARAAGMSYGEYSAKRAIEEGVRW